MQGFLSSKLFKYSALSFLFQKRKYTQHTCWTDVHIQCICFSGFLRPTRCSQGGSFCGCYWWARNLTALAVVTLGTFTRSTCNCPLWCSQSCGQHVSAAHLHVIGYFYERREWATARTNLERCWAPLARGNNQPHEATVLSLCTAGHAIKRKGMAGHWLLCAFVPMVSKEFGLNKPPGPHCQVLCNVLLSPGGTAMRSAHSSIHHEPLWKQTQPEMRLGR